MIMSDSQVYDDNTWHWKFLPGRIEDYKRQKAEFGLWYFIFVCLYLQTKKYLLEIKLICIYAYNQIKQKNK
jgi:hypothetical protein